MIDRARCEGVLEECSTTRAALRLRRAHVVLDQDFENRAAHIATEAQPLEHGQCGNGQYETLGAVNIANACTPCGANWAGVAVKAKYVQQTACREGKGNGGERGPLDARSQTEGGGRPVWGGMIRQPHRLVTKRKPAL